MRNTNDDCSGLFVDLIVHHIQLSRFGENFGVFKHKLKDHLVNGTFRLGVNQIVAFGNMESCVYRID